MDVPEGGKETFNRLLRLIPEEHRYKKTVIEMISQALRKYDEKYVKRNIELANKKAKTNYRGYLWKALQNDYAAENNFESKENKQVSDAQRKSSSQEKIEKVPLPSLSKVLKVPTKKEWSFEELVDLVRKDWRDDERVVEILLDAFEEKDEEKDEEYIIWNILSANKHMGLDYAVQLKHSLNGNYGALYRKQLGKDLLYSQK